MKLFVWMVLVAGALYFNEIPIAGDIWKTQEPPSDTITVDVLAKAFEGLSEEEKRSLRQEGLGPDSMTYTIKSPRIALKATLERMEKQARAVPIYKAYAAGVHFWRKFLETQGYLLRWLPVALILLGISFRILKLWFLMRLLGVFCFSAARIFLIPVCLAAVVVFFTVGENFWLDAGSILFYLPLAILVISSAILRMLDFNFPIWNSLFHSAVFPLLSGLVIYFYEPARQALFGFSNW